MTELLRLWEVYHWGNNMSCGLVGQEVLTMSPVGQGDRVDYAPPLQEGGRGKRKAHVRGCIEYFLGLQKPVVFGIKFSLCLPHHNSFSRFL